MLDDSEASDALTNKGLKYGLRPEAMCSESIDLDTNVTQSFCYRVAATPNATFASKVVGGRTLSASLALAEKTDITGSRMGVDRKGRVIKIKRYKRINMETGAADADSAEKHMGPEQTSWFRSLADRDKERVILASQNCEGLITDYGDEVKDMTVVSRARDLADYQRNFIERAGCRL